MSPFTIDHLETKHLKDRKKSLFSGRDNIAISILNGMSISKCSKMFEINKVRCQAILNIFCMKSNHYFYNKLQRSPFVWAPIEKLREHKAG